MQVVFSADIHFHYVLTCEISGTKKESGLIVSLRQSHDNFMAMMTQDKHRCKFICVIRSVEYVVRHHP